jgi:Ca-activated chloride channel family protein
MNFLWPGYLLLLLIIPLLITVYIWILRRKRVFAVRYSSLSLVREALPRHNWWHQHLPFILFLLGLACLVTAIARPQAEFEVPLSRTTIILAIDVSRSMCATDVSPNRLTVAQEADLAFIQNQADDTRIGIVAFAGFAEIVVPPTNDKEVLQEAIANFTTSLGTAIGSATLRSLDAIAEVNSAVAPSGVILMPQAGEPSPEETIYQPDIIVLLTDGANSQGPLPLDAAQQATDRQVRVYTIGFGTTNPEQLLCTSQQLGGDILNEEFGRDFGVGLGGIPGGATGSGFGGFRRYLVLDEPTLQGIADITGGVYYRAEDANQLYQVFVDLPTEIVRQKERLETSVIFSILGAIFTTISVVLSQSWYPFP